MTAISIHKLRIHTPCLFTALSQACSPRYMTVSGVVDANDKPIHRLGFNDVKDALDVTAIGLHGSPTNVVRSFTKEPRGQGMLLCNLSADEAVDAIMAKLHESHII